MKGMERNRGWLSHALILLASLVMITSWSLCGTYAKYVSAASGSSTARVAKFEVTDKGGWSQTEQLVAEVAPGDENSVYYAITVKNSSEVAISCQITAECEYSNLPLVFQMTDTEKKVLQEGQAVIPAGEAREQTYYLRIGWDETKTDASYAGKTDLIRVKFDAVQAD